LSSALESACFEPIKKGQSEEQARKTESERTEEDELHWQQEEIIADISAIEGVGDASILREQG